MIERIFLIVACHLMGDYFLQSNFLATTKGENWYHLTEKKEVVSAEETLAVVERWSEEHPRKTFLSDLLKKYPNIDLKVGSGVPNFCPEILGYKQKLKCGRISCKECWNQNLEE